MSTVPKEVNDAVKAYLRKGMEGGFSEEDLDRIARLLVSVSDFFFHPDKIPEELIPILMPANATIVTIQQRHGGIEVSAAVCKAHVHNNRIAMLIEMMRHFTFTQPQGDTTLN